MALLVRKLSSAVLRVRASARVVCRKASRQMALSMLQVVDLVSGLESRLCCRCSLSVILQLVPAI